MRTYHNRIASRLIRQFVTAMLPLLLGAWPSAWAQTMSTGIQVTAVLNRGTSFISVSRTNVTWNAFVMPPDLTRFNSDIMTCRFFPGNSPWDIMIYHTNGAGKNLMRGIAMDGGTLKTNWLMTRFWHPSLGPSNYYAEGILPSPMNQQVWNLSPGIWDRNVTPNPSFFARQKWGMGSPVDFHFIVDAASAYPNATYSGRVFFELSVP